MLVFPGFRGLNRSFFPRTSAGISARTSAGYPPPPQKLTLWAAFSFLISEHPQASHPGKIPGISQAPSFEAQGKQTFRRRTRTFRAPPVCVEDPPPTRQSPDAETLTTVVREVHLCALLSWLIPCVSWELVDPIVADPSAQDNDKRNNLQYGEGLICGKKKVHSFLGVIAVQNSKLLRNRRPPNGGFPTNLQRNRPNRQRTNCREHAR